MANLEQGSRPSTVVQYARRLYHPLGFKKGYNFVLFFISVGALLGFFFARASYMNIGGVYFKSALTGEVYWSGHGFRRIGITLHLVCILPASFLVCFQFVPIIRYKAILFHRINGYVVTLLLFLGNVGAFMIIKHTLGGALVTQIIFGGLALATTGAAVLAYINIKRLQIDQHRAWMIRTWAWASCIITVRVLLYVIKGVITNRYVFYESMRCAEIFWMYKHNAGFTDEMNPTSTRWPQCTSPDSTVQVSVPTEGDGVENLAAMIRVCFVSGALLAFLAHVVAAELYLGLTPAENERLRKVSYDRQVEAKYRHPEKGALTATRFGDAPPYWNSREDKHGEALRASDTSSEGEVTAIAVTVGGRQEPKTIG